MKDGKSNNTNRIIFLGMLIFALYAAEAWAEYNPPPLGVRLESISCPLMLTGASSCAGGALFSASPVSIAVNPAIIGDEQRVTFDAGYTALVSFGENFGSAFEAGALLPTPWCVGAVLLRGVFSPFDDMDLGNSITGTFALGKMVLEHLRIGASVSVGSMWSAGWSYLVAAGLGAIYDFGDLGFLSNVRLAGALTDFGKTFSPEGIPGIDDDEEADHFPVFFTPRAGAAATLFSTDSVTGGVSVDTYFPGVQNFVIAAGFAMTILDKWTVGLSQTVDFQELHEGLICAPALSVGYKLVLNAGGGKYKGSDMAISGGWQNMYGGIQAFSAGAVINMGARDTEGPEIKLGE